MKKAQLIEFTAGELVSGDYTGAIGVVEEIPANLVIKVTKESQVAHVVQKNGMAYETELALANAMSGNLTEFLDDPLRLILGSNEAAYPSLIVNSEASETKVKTLALFEDYLKSIRGARRIREPAIMMADELYTNAAKNGGYHGKRNGEKNGANSSEQSGEAKPQRPGSIEFFASCDETRLVFGCRDSYGDLGFSTVLNRINECFENGIVQSINNGSGGAGIGSFMVFKACISYYCGVEKGKRTVVAVALPLGSSADELDSFPKNIHLRAA
ncbi:MAG: hypothetical protein EOP05_07910 [Proteobacteria bacterium]|nr:MAG: hypothetical protein EOP05_07910 [Pseudomonadota bacterium]